MDEDRRAAMIGWFDDGVIDRQEAAQFVDDNTATRLPDALRDRAIADVEQSGREAWVGWLERGSREDWSARAGEIAVPALIVAGGDDGDLGEDAQRRLNLPHYPHGRVEVVAGAAHLLPYEAPHAVAALIAGHVGPALDHALPAPFQALLASDRVSARTRAVLTARHGPPTADGILTEPQRATLAALVETVLPGAADPVDLTRRIDAMLADGRGDGWRCAELPADGACWAAALDTLETVAGDTTAGDAHVTGFRRLDRPARDRLLRDIASDDAMVTSGPLTRAQMRLWFAEARAEIARQWMALPATMARIGYDGFAIGGDGPRMHGYVRAAADTIEPWQQPARPRA